jgi:hypothetical protein
MRRRQVCHGVRVIALLGLMATACVGAEMRRAEKDIHAVIEQSATLSSSARLGAIEGQLAARKYRVAERATPKEAKRLATTWTDSGNESSRLIEERTAGAATTLVVLRGRVVCLVHLDKDARLEALTLLEN